MCIWQVQELGLRLTYTRMNRKNAEMVKISWRENEGAKCAFVYNKYIFLPSLPYTVKFQVHSQHLESERKV